MHPIIYVESQMPLEAMKYRGSFASNWFVEIAGGRVMERTCRPEQLTQNPLKGLRNQNNEIEYPMTTNK